MPNCVRRQHAADACRYWAPRTCSGAGRRSLGDFVLDRFCPACSMAAVPSATFMLSPGLLDQRLHRFGQQGTVPRWLGGPRSSRPTSIACRNRPLHPTERIDNLIWDVEILALAQSWRPCRVYLEMSDMGAEHGAKFGQRNLRRGSVS
jgi:hypothetical protein